MYDKPCEKTKKKIKVGTGDTTRDFAQIGAGISASADGMNSLQYPVIEPTEEPEPQLNLWVALFTLVISTALMGLCAEAMVYVPISVLCFYFTS